METDAQTVTVKAGTFENCLKLTLQMERETNDPNYYFNRGLRFGTKEYWHAPGVGIVKIRFAWNSVEAATELVDYNLPAGGESYLPIHIGNQWTYEETNLTAEGYTCRSSIEIVNGADGKYLFTTAYECSFLGTAEEYDAFRAHK